MPVLDKYVDGLLNFVEVLNRKIVISDVTCSMLYFVPIKNNMFPVVYHSNFVCALL